MNEKSKAKRILLEFLNNQARQKIKPHHLRRRVIIFTRGPAAIGAAFLRTEDSIRVFELKMIALVLGWMPKNLNHIMVGSGVPSFSAECQNTFKSIRAEIARGQVGAVICSDITRMTRDHREFQQLVCICALNQTLIIVGSEIHDPNDFQSGILLGTQDSLRHKGESI